MFRNIFKTKKTKKNTHTHTQLQWKPPSPQAGAPLQIRLHLGLGLCFQAPRAELPPFLPHLPIHVPHHFYLQAAITVAALEAASLLSDRNF